MTQYYNGKSSSVEAKQVAVEAGQTKSGIDGAMLIGGQISGTVTNASTKAAITGIQVCASNEIDSQCAKTNSNGEYTVSGLATGSYKVYFSAPDVLNYLAQYYNGKASYSEAEAVSVTTGNTTSGIDAAIVTGGQIMGKVTAAATKVTLAGIQVCADPKSGGNGECASTNSSGEYVIAGLITSEYTVSFDPVVGTNYIFQYYNGKESSAEATPVTVAAGSTTPGINAAMAAGGQIAGRVTDASSKGALDGIEVCPRTTDGEYMGQCVTSNSAGEYTIVGLTTGEYKVEFYPNGGANYVTQYYDAESSVSEATVVSVTAGSTTPGINAEMRPGGEVAGKVTDATGSTAVSGIQVSVYEVNGDYPFAIAFATTNASGEYLVTGLGTGEYKVEFAVPYSSGLNYLPQYYKNQSSLAAAEAIEVTAGKTTAEVDAKLQAGGEITGRVTSASSKTALNGVQVCPHATNGEYIYLECTTTNASGEYSIVGLATGEYEVSFDVTGANYVEQYYNGAASVDEAESVSVTAGSTTPSINAAMVVGGEIAGKATAAATKAALEDVNVCATPTSGVCGETNSAGEYTISGLSANEYTVEFSYAGQCGPDGCTGSLSQSVLR